MNFLLKIVEGPNKGAEIALVEGVSVTLGKADDCDIILADPTLPDAPMEISATADAVLVDGAVLEPFNVRTAGSTGIAVGPADAPWGPLVWPKPEAEAESEKPEAESPAEPAPAADGRQPPQEAGDGERKPEKAGRRRSCLGCLLVLILLLLLLALLGWFFRVPLRAKFDSLRDDTRVKWRASDGGTAATAETDIPISPNFALEKLAGSHGLSLEERDNRVILSGNFATRAERLKTTAEAYAARPGIDLDFTDDESFRTAAEDSLFTLTEGAIKGTVATNRYLHLAGTSETPVTLQKTMEQLNADLPKLRGFDVSGVKIFSPASTAPVPAASAQRSGGSTAQRPARPTAPSLPVCGILTTPYPCLVMRDGRRISTGGIIGDSVILSIAADEVVITNSAGRFTWKP